MPFNLKKSKNILRIRTPDILWQKERLLNIVIDQLTDICKKVVWIDCDVLFENPGWAVETSKKLDHFKIVQPFAEAIRLPKNTSQFSGIGTKNKGFGW